MAKLMAKPKRKANVPATASRANINELVTHKEKEIHKNGTKLKNIKSDKKGSIEDVSDGEDSGNEFGYNLDPVQAEKEKMIEYINKLFAKNKINNKNAFDVPILGVRQLSSGFSYDAIDKDMAWRRLSSVMENDYKIYGHRVDSISEYIHKMAHLLCRHGSEEADKENANPKGEKKNHKEVAEKEAANAINSVQETVNLGQYLERNVDSLNLSQKARMLRKDPLFEQTRRKFDQLCLTSLFMNTLQLNMKNLEMMIEYEESEAQRERKIQLLGIAAGKDFSQTLAAQLNVVNEEEGLEGQNEKNKMTEKRNVREMDEEKKQVLSDQNRQDRENQESQRQVMKKEINTEPILNSYIVAEIQRIRNCPYNISKNMTVLYHNLDSMNMDVDFFIEDEKTSRYFNIVNMALAGQLKSAFDNRYGYGEQYGEIDSEEEEEQKQSNSEFSGFLVKKNEEDIGSVSSKSKEADKKGIFLGDDQSLSQKKSKEKIVPKPSSSSSFSSSIQPARESHEVLIAEPKKVQKEIKEQRKNSEMNIESPQSSKSSSSVLLKIEAKEDLVKKQIPAPIPNQDTPSNSNNEQMSYKQELIPQPEERHRDPWESDSSSELSLCKDQRRNEKLILNSPILSSLQEDDSPSKDHKMIDENKEENDHQEIQDQNENGLFIKPTKFVNKNTRKQRNNKKIKDVIKIKKSCPKKSENYEEPIRRQRRNILNVKDLARQERKKQTSTKRGAAEKANIREKELFDFQEKENMKAVLKQEKKTYYDVKNEVYVERNLMIEQAVSNFQIKIDIFMRPEPTKEQIRREKQKRLKELQQKMKSQPHKGGASQNEVPYHLYVSQNEEDNGKGEPHLKKEIQEGFLSPAIDIENVSESEQRKSGSKKGSSNSAKQGAVAILEDGRERSKQEIDVEIEASRERDFKEYKALEQQLRKDGEEQQIEGDRQMIQFRKTPSMSRIKQKIIALVKKGSKSFKEVYKYFVKKYGKINPTIIFIALLHLANEKHFRLTRLEDNEIRITVNSLR